VNKIQEDQIHGAKARINKVMHQVLGVLTDHEPRDALAALALIMGGCLHVMTENMSPEERDEHVNRISRIIRSAMKSNEKADLQ
jgi:hypothetical protein